jgi:FkbM family methyltransferase
MKQAIKSALYRCGIDVRRAAPPVPAVLVGSDRRPVGDMLSTLEDLRHRELRCDSIMDVGANRGWWSKLAAAVFPEARLTLIEPQEELLPDLEQFVSSHPGSRYILSGVGASEGRLPLTLWDDTMGSSFRAHPDASLRQREVPVTTIDCLIAQGTSVPDLIKLDVQGFELDVLRGASSTFGVTEAYIIEVCLYPFYDGAPSFYDVVSFMHERQYAVYDFPGFGRRPSDGALGYCDVCFVKEGGFLRSSNSW